jgi:hypothetical protein
MDAPGSSDPSEKTVDRAKEREYGEDIAENLSGHTKPKPR